MEKLSMASPISYAGYKGLNHALNYRKLHDGGDIEWVPFHNYI